MACPNILFILVDQLRIDCVRAWGNPDVQTPHLDALVANGTRYDHCCCPFPVCTPSRYSLLSGLYPYQHGGLSNHSTLAPGLATWPGLLRKAGYRTHAVGKMHMTPTYLDVGFSHMELAEQNGPGRFDDDYHRQLMAQGLLDVEDVWDQCHDYRAMAPREYWDTFGALPSRLPEAWHSTSWVGERAIAALTNWQEEGELLMASFVKPHHPFDPPEPWASMYDPDALTIPPGWTEQIPEQDHAWAQAYFDYELLDEQKMRRVLALYYASISQIDHQVGRMIDILRQRGLYDDTLIVFCSDHGEHMGFHHMLLKGGPMYDPLIKVPLSIKWPGNTRAGEVRGLASLVDLCPTICAQAGVVAPRGHAGIDLSDFGREREMAFAHAGLHTAHPYMVRSSRYKLMLGRSKEASMLFDLAEDPLELDNRIADPAYATIFEQHREALLATILFDAPAPLYLDEDARYISAPNVPTDISRQREHSAAYIAEQMRIACTNHSA